MLILFYRLFFCMILEYTGLSNLLHLSKTMSFKKNPCKNIERKHLPIFDHCRPRFPKKLVILCMEWRLIPWLRTACYQLGIHVKWDSLTCRVPLLLESTIYIYIYPFLENEYKEKTNNGIAKEFDSFQLIVK